MKLKRALPCDVCGIEIVLSRKRLHDMARTGQKPLCEQCRRYVIPGTARMSQPISETEVASLRLREKVGSGAKTKRGLASYPLKRCGTTGCEPGVAVSE